jgi:hypothetical protein
MPPTAALSSLAPVVTLTINAGMVWHHIFLDRYRDPIGYGFHSSRFSDPRRVKRPFGVW